MHNASAFKNVPISPLGFLLGQLREAGNGNVPLWLLGFAFFLFAGRGRPFRFFAWAYAAIFLVMALQNGKPYYLSPIFPLLFTAGAVLVDQMVAKRGRKWLVATLACLILLGMTVNTPFALPVLSARCFIGYQHALGQSPRWSERSGIGVLPQHYADEMGWEELTAQVAALFHRLSPDEQKDCWIFMRNYGEAGAIDFFGPKYGLPPATCAHNSYWYWGFPDWKGSAAIIFGTSHDIEENLRDLRSHFEQVELGAVTHCDLAMPYENNRPIFICRRAKFSLRDIWADERFFI
jgi:hypothetical protein